MFLAALAGCDVVCVDALHWLYGYNLYAIAEGQAYRSRQPDAALLDHVVETYGIRTVINLRGENAGETWYDTEARRLAELGVSLVNIGMSAQSPPSAETLLALYEAFLTVDYPILIHCQAGADRAGAAAAIWRMAVAGDERSSALSELDCKYGHFRAATPAMDWLAEAFLADANWITDVYDPNGFYDVE
ncbi:MAG: tyrosine-protein phosphatase [Phycisphaerae bacterium]|nr:tyrosine-protein phosphatase [Phycisphaerae bacterium]